MPTPAPAPVPTPSRPSNSNTTPTPTPKPSTPTDAPTIVPTPGATTNPPKAPSSPVTTMPDGTVVPSVGPHPTPRPEDANGLTQEEIDNINKQLEERKQNKFYEYFNAGYTNVPEDVAVKMFDNIVKADADRRITPISKYDNVSYIHRYAFGDIMYSLTLGDSKFVIPPTAISVTSESSGQELVTLRQENTQKIKNGYTKRTIVVELVFHGYEQINGYKVDSPEGYYYVDGLRQLLAQFKCTPFLPITNYTINNTYGISTVALQSIVCSTVEGFPDMIIANLTLQEVDLYPYIEIPSMFYEDIIDWDLFRFYYQRQLTEIHEYGKLQSIPINKELNSFKISILNESVFSDNIDYDIDMETWYDDKYNLKGKKTNFSFYDIVLDKKIIHFDENGKWSLENPSKEYPTNYVTYVDSKEDNIHISSFQCGYSNIITNIQLAEMAHPTVQYMGGMDTMFNITFETTDENIITKIENCNLNNNKMIRDNKDFASVGFIKLESELVELFGSKFVMVDNVTTHTVPDFPGLFIVQMHCISFDAYQKAQEGIIGFNPFEDDREGNENDTIEQSPAGLNTKIKQDLCIENKIRTSVELYPDLKLPKYSEVDEIIKKIKNFRKTYKDITGTNLSPYPLDRYPRNPQHSFRGISKTTKIETTSGGFVTNVPEIIKNGARYEEFVDPDFYVFYPDTYKELMKEAKEELQENNLDSEVPKAKSKNYVITKTTSIKNTTDSVADIASFSREAVYSDGATELQLQFITLARNKIGKPYSNDNGNVDGRDLNRTGPNAYDCSGLVGQCLYEMGILSSPYITTTTVKDLINNGTLKIKHEVSDKSKTSELIAKAVPGDLLHIYSSERNSSSGYGHIAIYVGDNKVVHAAGKKKGVVEETYGNSYRRLLEVPKLLEGKTIYEETKQEVTTNKEHIINPNIQKGDKGDNVLKLQEALNSVNNAKLELDGSFGPATEQAVIAFQEKYSIKDDRGYVGKKTANKIKELANVKLNTSYSNTTIINNSNKTSITENELMAIAKTIANIQLTNYDIQMAFAQLIYDMFTDVNAKYGTLSDILNSNYFNGQYPKTLPVGSTAYKAAADVFCNNKRVSNKRVVKYLGLDSSNVDYYAYDNKYTRLDTMDFGEYTFWIDNNTNTLNKAYTLDNENGLFETTITEQIEINTGVTNIDEDDEGIVELFGMPTLIETEKMDGDSGWIWNAIQGKGGNQVDYYKSYYNTDEQRLTTSYVNQCEYSGKGRLLKAFPTYLFCVVDEDGNWLNGKKLWGNYYMLRSLVDIQVVNYNDSPVNTATITVTNSYGNLDTLPPNSIYYSVLNDDTYGGLNKALYKHFNMLLGGPKVTEDLIEMKNIIYDSMVVRAGSRMHLRMGYGSDPLSLPVVMNGYISDLSLGDITQFVCVSDGVELVNNLITDNPKDVNNDKETSNIYMTALSARQNWTGIISRSFGEPNEYGIEHFGLYMSMKIDVPDWSEDMFKNKDGKGIGLPKWLVGSMNWIQGVGETIVSLGRYVGDDFFKTWSEIQYDMNKNIYRTNNNGSLAMYSPFFGLADGEENIRFSTYNKTPWDAMQMGLMNAPEYIGMPMYHQFESRMFLGLPFWMAKYRYNIINDKTYEESKTYAQVHFIDSLTDIIDNQIVTSSRDLYTNTIIMYSKGKNGIEASPTLYSDKTIDVSQQSTRIYDSSVSQNLLGPEVMWDLLGMKFGKEQSCRVGTAQLLWNWEKAYQGDMLLLGDAGIFPNDYMFINDRFNELSGICKARTVTHSLSAKTGFITTVTPGMVALSTAQESQAHKHLANIMLLGSHFSKFALTKKLAKDNAEKLSEWYNDYKYRMDLIFWSRIGNFALGAGSLVGMGIYTVKSGKNLYKMFKGAEEFAHVVKEFRAFKNAFKLSLSTVKTAKKIKSFSSVKRVLKATSVVFKRGSISFKALFAKGGGAAGTAAGPLGTAGGILIGAVIGIVLDVLLEWVVDFLSYNHLISLLPLTHKGIPYAPILSGKKLIMTTQGTDENE